MKILVSHNAYQMRGGEDEVVDAEISLLRSYGHEVLAYRRHNDELQELGKVAAGFSTFWSRRSFSEIQQACKDFSPDVIHAHNTFPLISPSLYWAADTCSVPVVQTLHNFRLLCPQATFLRQGKICEDCLGKGLWRAVERKCYRDSYTQTAVLAGMLSLHRSLGTFRHKVTRYIALNEFCRDKFIQGGLPADRIRIKPNFSISGRSAASPSRRGGLYVGRLSAEKGVDVLVEAAGTLAQAEIEIIGSGPLETAVKDAFGERWVGFQPLDRIFERMNSALFLVLPSVCYESSPRTITEAFSCGLPVIASRLGALPEIVNDGVTGLLFTPGDSTDLAAKIAWACAHPERMEVMGKAARQEYEAKYTPEANYRTLLDIYHDAIACTRPESEYA